MKNDPFHDSPMASGPAKIRDAPQPLATYQKRELRASVRRRWSGRGSGDGGLSRYRVKVTVFTVRFSVGGILKDSRDEAQTDVLEALFCVTFRLLCHDVVSAQTRLPSMRESDQTSTTFTTYQLII